MVHLWSPENSHHTTNPRCQQEETQNKAITTQVKTIFKYPVVTHDASCLRTEKKDAKILQENKQQLLSLL